MPLSKGERLGPYEILEQVGAGGMGQVYRAYDTSLNRTVAIKTSNELFSKRFECEARSVAALNHPNMPAAVAATENSGRILCLDEGRCLVLQQNP